MSKNEENSSLFHLMSLEKNVVKIFDILLTIRFLGVREIIDIIYPPIVIKYVVIVQVGNTSVV